LSLLSENARVIDLSHPIYPGMQTFGAPWHKGVEFESLGTMESVGRRTTHVHIGTHAGTHIDAPSHFIPEGKTIEKLNLRVFNGAATKIDLTHIEKGESVTLEALKRACGDLPLGTRTILCYGWSHMYGSSSFYTNSPYLSEDAANWLLDQNVKFLGYDTPMPDSPNHGFGTDCDSPMHKLFLEAEVPLLEYMNNLEQLPKTFFLSANPLSMIDLDGSPVRCVGIVNLDD
jgi:arylformamidase